LWHLGIIISNNISIPKWVKDFWTLLFIRKWKFCINFSCSTTWQCCGWCSTWVYNWGSKMHLWQLQFRSIYFCLQDSSSLQFGSIKFVFTILHLLQLEQSILSSSFFIFAIGSINFIFKILHLYDSSFSNHNR
jgi:hypothetical protein